jgi:hypothetical protein
MQDRVLYARNESDTAYFYSLLFYGEMLTKMVTLGLVSALSDDVERHRYRLFHRLVHADGLGDWPSVLDDALTGPASQHLLLPAREEQRQLTERHDPGVWQSEAARLLHACLTSLDPSTDPLPAKIDLRKWFAWFTLLRNRTRGHGAQLAQHCANILPELERSLDLILRNFRLFHRQWAYLHRNLSGKYRVVPLTADVNAFDHLKSTADVHYLDGVYVHLETPVPIPLIFSSVDAADFLLPNGAFKGRTFEILSYITGTISTADGTPYLAPSTDLPASETQGLGLLQVEGKTFTNLPQLRPGYISRPQLEQLVVDLLLDDRHPIVTLAGRGGIGKTWLALSVLHQIALSARYFAIIWLSARDIDLLPEGPKLVRPKVLSTHDMARDFVNLLDIREGKAKGAKPESVFAQWLTASPVGPLLLVFDNFETVRSPAELYVWLDTYVRPPNKILITTRTREFKGDYPLEVSGMTEPEAGALVDDVARRLAISSLLTDSYRRDLYREAEGHPYVTRVLLGEVAKARKLVSIERIMAAKDEILDALFERTFAGLSPAARRVFLTLSSWHVTLPRVAVEAVLLRPENEKLDLEEAFTELAQMSLIETMVSEDDKSEFVVVPLAAALFGKRKLAVSPMRTAVEVDVELLRAFGAGRLTDVRRGAEPRIRRLFRSVAEKIVKGSASIDEYLPMLEFVARRYPPAWSLLASLFEEAGDLERAKNAIRSYLEVAALLGHEAGGAWARLFGLCEVTNDWISMIHALVEIAEQPDIAFSVISDAANRANDLLRQNRFALDVEEKRIIARRLARVMESRADEASAGDLSRLAWLFLHLREQEKAREFTARGLRMEPDNHHIQNLADRLKLSMPS